MSGQNKTAPIVIKRKKVVAGGGHHGGAWKVAYADFVTAMMAFFLMMWLLGSTTDSQRRGIADYFSPSISIYRISAGGDGILGGLEMAARDRMGQAVPDTPHEGEGPGAFVESATELRGRLAGMGGESLLMSEALRHVVSRITDEGLVIEIFDLPDMPLFEGETDTPRPVLRTLAAVLAQVLVLSGNPVAVEGHVRAVPLVRMVDPRWPLSMDRAARMRALLEGEGLDPARLARVTGHADRRPAAENTMSVRNNRIEVILLRNPSGR